MGKEEKKKMEQKDELTNSGQRFPVEQVSNTGKPTKKQVKAAVKMCIRDRFLAIQN